MTKAALIKRLSWYWVVEAANAPLLAGIAIAWVASEGAAVSPAMGLAMAAAAFLLLVGAGAWRFELAGLKGEAALAARLLPPLAGARLPGLVLTLAALGVAAFDWTRTGWTPPTIAAAAFAVLAGLEWINYYAVQLQHFDNRADLRRLLTGRGFREAHLAKAIRRSKVARTGARG